METEIARVVQFCIRVVHFRTIPKFLPNLLAVTEPLLRIGLILQVNFTLEEFQHQVFSPWEISYIAKHFP